jgi:hypothetical protein
MLSLLNSCCHLHSCCGTHTHTDTHTHTHTFTQKHAHTHTHIHTHTTNPQEARADTQLTHRHTKTQTHTHTHQLDAARKALDGKDVDYEATLAFKKGFARKVFNMYGEETLQSSEFKVGRGRLCVKISQRRGVAVRQAQGALWAAACYFATRALPCSPVQGQGAL